MTYNLLIEVLKAGQLPSLTGCHFTQDQAAEIKAILDDRKKQIENYYILCVALRIEKRTVA